MRACVCVARQQQRRGEHTQVGLVPHPLQQSHHVRSHYTHVTHVTHVTPHAAASAGACPRRSRRRPQQHAERARQLHVWCCVVCGVRRQWDCQQRQQQQQQRQRQRQRQCFRAAPRPGPVALLVRPSCPMCLRCMQQPRGSPSLSTLPRPRCHRCRGLSAAAVLRGARCVCVCACERHFAACVLQQGDSAAAGPHTCAAPTPPPPPPRERGARPPPPPRRPLATIV
jgi:hypothetical protein